MFTIAPPGGATNGSLQTTMEAGTEEKEKDEGKDEKRSEDDTVSRSEYLCYQRATSRTFCNPTQIMFYLSSLTATTSTQSDLLQQEQWTTKKNAR